MIDSINQSINQLNSIQPQVGKFKNTTEHDKTRKSSSKGELGFKK